MGRKTPKPLPFEFTTRGPQLADDPTVHKGLASAMEHRDRQLEDYLAGLLPFQTYNLTGPLTESRSDDWPTLRSWLLTDWVVSLTVAGSDDTDVDLLIDGVVVASMTLAAGETIASASLDHIDIAALETMVAAEVTTAGTDAEGLVVQVYGSPA